MLVNVRIGPKLVGGFGLVAALGLAVGLVGISGMSAIKSRSDQVTAQVVPQLRAIGEYSLGLGSVRRYEMGMVVARAAGNDSLLRQYKTEVRKALQEQVEVPRTAFDKVPRTAVADSLFRVLRAREAAYLATYAGVVALVDQNKLPEAMAMVTGPSRAAYNALLEAFADLSTRVQSTAGVREAEIVTVYGLRRNILLGVSVLALVFALAFGARLARSITQPVTAVAHRADSLRRVCITGLDESLDALAHGDTSRELVPSTSPLQYERADELGDLARTIDEMIMKAQASISSYNRMRGVLGRLVEETTQLAAAGRDGKLSTRGRATDFEGAYRDIVQGVNDTLDAVIDPVNEAAAVLDRVAARDLTVRVAGAYKGDHARIKEALNRAVDDLAHALADVAKASEQVASASGQIANGSTGLAQGASEQASSIEEVSASLHEMTAMAQQSAKNARDARVMAETAKAATLKGHLHEVRALAIRSAEASKQTADLIEESGRHAADGVSYTGEVVAALDEIADRATAVTEVMGEIALASEQQQTGVARVNTAIEQMNLVTQQIASNSEESASAAEELSSQAAQLQDMLGRFTLSAHQQQPQRRGVRRAA